MHFGMFFSTLCLASKMSELEDGGGKKMLMKKRARKQIECCFISHPLECLRHWLNDLWVDNSLKARNEKNLPTNDDSHSGAEVSSFNFDSRSEFYIKVLVFEARQKSDLASELRFFSKKTLFVSREHEIEKMRQF